MGGLVVMKWWHRILDRRRHTLTTTSVIRTITQRMTNISTTTHLRNAILEAIITTTDTMKTQAQRSESRSTGTNESGSEKKTTVGPIMRTPITTTVTSITRTGVLGRKRGRKSGVIAIIMIMRRRNTSITVNTGDM